MITFENYHRKIEKINRVLSAYDISSLEDAKAVCEEKGIDPKSQRKFSRSALRMYAGHMLPARLSQSRKVQFMQVTRHAQSAKAFRHSAFRVPSQKTEKSGSDTETLRRCFSARKLSALHSLRDTNPLLRQKVQSV